MEETITERLPSTAIRGSKNQGGSAGMKRDRPLARPDDFPLYS